MTRALGVLIFVVLVLSLVRGQTGAIIGKVCTNSGYSGSCTTIYDNSAIADFTSVTSIGNNAISSMQFLAAGYFVDIYDGANWTGASKRYRTDVEVTSLSNESPSWNDRVTSLKVTPVPVAEPGITIWKDKDRGSASQYFGAGDWVDITTTGFPNDAASSVRQWPYTQAFLLPNVGGIAQCPGATCAIYGATTLGSDLSTNQLSSNDQASSVYVAAYMTPTTTTAAASTTAVAVTTSALASTTNAAVASTTTVQAATVHNTVTTGLAAANSGGAMKRSSESKATSGGRANAK